MGAAWSRAAPAVYYGPGYGAALWALGQRPCAAVQASAFSPGELRALRAGGTRLLAYLSLGEDHPLGDWAARPGSAPYHREVNPDWGSVRVQPDHPLWQRLVLERAEQALADTDGLLLDTLDSAPVPGLLTLIRQLSDQFPQAALIANRGFELLPAAAPLLGGVLFEAFSTAHSPYRLHDAAGLAYTAGRLEAVRGLGLPVTALDYADTPALASAARARAQALGLQTFVSDRELSLPGGFPG